ncbi:MAG: hypothetical protein J7527_02445 [Chitinophagaceae bacterium]|nr:hypothetical protein [Chitinophagaceae bacterium]
METNDKRETGKASDTDKKYDGTKDEYGGVMTGTGYGRQAEESKENTEKPETGDSASAAEKDEVDNEENKETKGFNAGLGQGSGYDKNSDRKK